MTRSTLILRRKARLLYANPNAPDATNRHNQRAWLRSVLCLGERWLFATPINRPLKLKESP
jgi:hypothetical protein